MDGSRGRSWTPVARSEDIDPAEPHAVSARDVDVVLVRHDGQLKAFEGICPHQGALLGEGELEGDRLICRNHRWAFDLYSGQRDGGPECLRSCPVREQDGEISVDVSRLLRPTETSAPRRRLRIEDLPGPPGMPLVGHAPHLGRPDTHLRLCDWANEYGSMYKIRFGRRRPWAVIKDPDLMAQALKARPKTFRRVSTVERVMRELGFYGVFAAEGEAWRPQRRLAMGALAQRHLKSFYPTLRETAERLVHHWRHEAERGTVLELPAEFMKFTVDVTTTLAFGRDLNTIERGETELSRYLAPILPAASVRITAPFPYWRYIKRESDRELETAVDKVKTWVRSVIEETRAELEAHPERKEHPRNFMEAMLVARDERGRPFSEETIIGNAFNMLLGGEDTTANTLSWSVHQLCDSPRATERLQAELDGVLGDAEIPPTAESLGDLPYAGAVGEEALRMRPVAPFLFNECNEPVVLGDLELDTGDIVILLLRLAADEGVETPHAFRPERWLDPQGEGAQLMKQGRHVPFGTGPRICPGRSLALLEIRLALAALYRNFDVERVGWSSDVRERNAFIMGPVNLKVRLHARG